jgi:signal transduction histidine kinase
MVVLLLRLRLRRAEGEFRAVLGERNRIAREIHDTLAQGYVGIRCSWRCWPSCCA